MSRLESLREKSMSGVTWPLLFRGPVYQFAESPLSSSAAMAAKELES
ncbi:MAG: hypothetical protein ACLP59_25710 [Bryobacteraceae bacterium]